MKPKQFNAIKILDHLDVAKAIVRGENPYPISYEIDPSNTCNHECIWCMYDDFMQRKKTMISKEMFRPMIEEILSLGAKSITFTGGGDPLTNPQTIGLMPYIKQNGVSVALITNGGLLNKEKCRIIVENCSYIRVSVDAGCEAVHNELHRSKNKKNDNFTKILGCLSSLVSWKRKLKKNIQIGAGFLVHPKNAREILAFTKQMKKIGVDYVQIRPTCNLNRDERETIVKMAKGQISQSLKSADKNFGIFPMLHRFDEIISIEKSYDTCYGHGLVGTIGADCNVYLCCQLKGNNRYMLGSLKKNSFKEIWNSRRRKTIARELNSNACPPCRYSRYNEILEYLADEDKIHTEFL